MSKGNNEDLIATDMPLEDVDKLLESRAKVVGTIAESLAKGKIVAMEYFPDLTKETKDSMHAIINSELEPVVCSRVASLHLQGYSPEQISAMLSIPKWRVTRALKSEDCQHFITEVTEAIKTSAKDYLGLATVKAVKVFIEAMDSPNEKIKLAAAKEVLNRTGIKEAQEIKISKSTSIEDLSQAELEDLIRMGLDSIPPIDAEVLDE